MTDTTPKRDLDTAFAALKDIYLRIDNLHERALLESEIRDLIDEEIDLVAEQVGNLIDEHHEHREAINELIDKQNAIIRWMNGDPEPKPDLKIVVSNGVEKK